MKMFKMVALAAAMALCLNTAAFAESRNTVTKSEAVLNGTSLADTKIEIVPYSEVATGDVITIKFTNATVFSQAVIDGKGEPTEKGYNKDGYQFRDVDGQLWNGVTGFYDVMKYENSSKVPYIITRMSDEEIKVELCNIPSEYADGSLYSVNGVGKAPYYSIPVVAYADSETPAVISAIIDGNGTSISDGDVMKGNTSVDKATTSSTVTSSTTTTEAQTETTTAALDNNVSVSVGSKVMIVNNTSYSIDTAPYIQIASSSTMVPLRAVSTALAGVDENDDMIKWDAENKVVTINYKGNTLVFTINSNDIIINGKKKSMDYGVVAEIKDSRTFVPFRALGEALGAEVDWEADTKTATYKAK